MIWESSVSIVEEEEVERDEEGEGEEGKKEKKDDGMRVEEDERRSKSPDSPGLRKVGCGCGWMDGWQDGEMGMGDGWGMMQCS